MFTRLVARITRRRFAVVQHLSEPLSGALADKVDVGCENGQLNDHDDECVRPPSSPVTAISAEAAQEAIHLR
jgi:hypothetical protein